MHDSQRLALTQIILDVGVCRSVQYNIALRLGATKDFNFIDGLANAGLPSDQEGTVFTRISTESRLVMAE